MGNLPPFRRRLRRRPQPANYSRVQVVLHWTVVLLLIGQYATSGAIVRTHSLHIIGQRQNPRDLLLHLLHNRAGLLLVALMLARLACRLWSGVPPITGTGFAGTMARLVHGAFYGVVIIEGVSGAVASYLWWPVSTLHVVLFKILLGLAAIHIAAALWQQFVLKDTALQRMWARPFRRLQQQQEG